jgi:hypothetical protein
MKNTNKELESIRCNLKKAFGVDYIPVDTKIKNLYKNRKFIPCKGDMLYMFLSLENEKFGLKQGWNRIKVTYVRSGVVFFRYIDSQHYRTEDSAHIDSIVIQEAYAGTIRLKDIGVPEQNLPLIRFDKHGCPFGLDIKTK